MSSSLPGDAAPSAGTVPPARDASGLASMRALLFDLDGVLTPTAEVHMRAWARLFSDYFEAHGLGGYGDADYFEYIDGRPRYDGVRAMLLSRGVDLPEGSPADPATADTVCGLGNRKNDVFESELGENGVTPYPGSVALVDAALASGMQVAVVSSSRNARPVLEAAGLIDRFDVIVDGVVAAADGLAGKPAPDTYLEGALKLHLPPELCVVVEDATSGVQAGAAGPFGLVVGVDRGATHQALLDNGADFVVDDLAELVPALPASPSQRSTPPRPSPSSEPAS